MKKLLLIVFASISTFAFAQSGISWNMGMNISTNTYSCMHPRIALDGKGNPMVIWGRMSDESLFFSKWNGTAFITPIKINPTGFKVATASWMGPDIASKGDTVYVVFKRAPETSDTNYIYILTSFNAGASFSSPVRVDYIADSISRFPTVTVDAVGNPIVAFMKFNSSFMQSRWVVTKSADYGKTFSTDVVASGYSGTNAEACDCCPGAIVSSGNISAMLYRDNFSNIRDIWTGISTNNNVSFNSGFAIDNTKWMINSCPASGPDGVIIGDSLYSVFLSAGSGNFRTYISSSSISSGAVKSVSRLSGNFTGLSQQNYPRIATYGKAGAIVWKQTTSTGTQLPILFTNDISNGFPTTYDTVDLKDITNADVAMSNGNIFVVWQDDNSGTVKFRSATYTPVNTSVNEYNNYRIEQNSFSVFPNPATDILNVISADNEKYVINIYNAVGEKIYNTASTSNTKIEISNYATGIYFLQILAPNNFNTIKIIKQ